jgi:hypothetical protein
MGHQPNLRSFSKPKVFGRSGAVSRSPVAAPTRRDSSKLTREPAVQTAAGPVIEVDHAVFTSVRTPTGEGYRIVAASSGIRPNEKTEITRRCPSHGALCSEFEDTSALMGFALPTGRFCVAYSDYAGTEHTARGGQRVYTHVVLLDPPGYRRFGCNPVRVSFALKSVIGGSPDPKPPAHLELLSLPLPSSVDGVVTKTPRMFADGLTDQLTNMLAHVVSDCRTVVAGVDSPLAALELLVMALPMFMREGLSFSVGVKFAPSRQTHFNLVDPDHGEMQRKMRGQNVQYFQMGSIPAGKANEYQGWFGLVRRWWTAGRVQDLCRLTNRLARRVPAGTLGWIATICNDVDRIRGAELPVLDDLAAKYNGFMADDPVESELARELLTKLEDARAQHDQQQESDENPPADENVTSGHGCQIRG